MTTWEFLKKLTIHQSILAYTCHSTSNLPQKCLKDHVYVINISHKVGWLWFDISSSSSFKVRLELPSRWKPVLPKWQHSPKGAARRSQVLSNSGDNHWSGRKNSLWIHVDLKEWGPSFHSPIVVAARSYLFIAVPSLLWWTNSSRLPSLLRWQRSYSCGD